MGQKRVLTIQDYSVLGRCSLTVALPILSAIGVEVCGIPTAVLSNHTAYSSWTYCDLTENIRETVDKWDDYKNDFDTIYTGYLGTEQVDIVINVIDKLRRKNQLVVVDPAFADGGKMYAGFASNHIQEMKKLIKKADLICPNLTEACFLTSVDYNPNINGADLLSLLEKLSFLGPSVVIITSLKGEKEDELLTAIYNRNSKERLTTYKSQKLKGTYHGAGDTFCSALTGCLTRGIDLNTSVKIANDFVHKSMEYGIEDGVDGVLYGLEFEKALPQLIEEVSRSLR